ncbi:MAG: hypothetical protein Q9195_002472 [Heterodermia aff. obscurata]
MSRSNNSTSSPQNDVFRADTAFRESFTSRGETLSTYSSPSAESSIAEESGSGGRIRAPVDCNTIRDNTRSPKTPAPIRPQLPIQPKSEPVKLPTQSYAASQNLEIPGSRSANNGTGSSRSTRSSTRRKSSPCTIKDPGILEHDTDQFSSNNETNTGTSPSPPSRRKTSRSNAVNETGSAQSNRKSLSSDRASGRFPSQDLDIDDDFVMDLTSISSQSSEYDKSSDPGEEGTSLDDPRPASLSSNSNVISENPANSTEPIQFHKTHDRKDFSLRDISSQIFKCIQKAAVCNNRRLEDGHIYVIRMKDRKYQEYVKIGRTTKIPERMARMEYACGYQLDAVDESCFTKVSCHKRLEAIIHLELLNERHHFSCSCKAKGKKHKEKPTGAHVKDEFTTHGEWFKIDYNEALSKVQKWRDWMQREPYELGGALALEWEEQIEYLNRKTDYAELLTKERERDQLWKSFREHSGFPWIGRFILAARRGPDGRRIASRWNSVRANWRNLILFFMAQYLVIQCIEWAGKEGSDRRGYMYGFLGLMNLYWL